MFQLSIQEMFVRNIVWAWEYYPSPVDIRMLSFIH